MPYTVIERVDQPFDPTLPFWNPSPLIDDVLWRLETSGLQEGPLTEWISSEGAPHKLTRNAGAASVIRIDLGEKDAYPAVNFAAGDVMRASNVATPIPADGGTIYLAFASHTSLLGTNQMILDFNGAFVALNAEGRIRLQGTGGGPQTDTAPITNASRYVVAIRYTATQYWVNFRGVIGTSSLAMGTLNRIAVGSTAVPFRGFVLDAFVCSGQHTDAQQNAQLAAMRDFYQAL